MLKLFENQSKFDCLICYLKSEWLKKWKNKLAFFQSFIYSLIIKSFDNQTIRMVLVNGAQFWTNQYIISWGF